MLLNIILLVVGLSLLVLGADWLVRGASSIAQKLRVSAMVIGAATAGLLFAFMFLGKKHQLTRLEGGLFLAAYVTYTGYLIQRG